VNRPRGVKVLWLARRDSHQHCIVPGGKCFSKVWTRGWRLAAREISRIRSASGWASNQMSIYQEVFNLIHYAPELVKKGSNLV